MIFIGIDPGMKGGVAFTCNEKKHYAAFPMPQTRRQLCDLLYSIKALYDQDTIKAVVECVHSMPKQGVASTFKFGKGYGEVLGILAALGVEIHEPTPQAWKKLMLAGTDKGKDASIQVAENMFPDIQLVLKGCRKPHDGMAEALLMAEYGRLTLL